MPLAVAAALLVALVLLWGQIRATFDPELRRQQRIEALRQADLDSRLDWLDTLVAAGWRVLPLAFVAGAGVVGLLVVYRRYADHRYIQASHLTSLTRAQTQRFPAQLHSLSFHDSSKQIPPAVVEAPAALNGSPALPVPTFAALLDQGAIGEDSEGRKQPLILGYADDGPITGDWRSLYSSGIGGLQGSGKTWGAAFLLAQSALNGARLVVCDPHAHDSESLAARVSPLSPAFLCDIADDDKSILAALRLADDVLRRRKKGDTDRMPVIVAVDEWASLRRGQLAEALPTFIEDFSTEGRKLNCHVMLLSQRWDKHAIGDFRNTLASSYVYRMRPDEARMMTGLRSGMMPQDTLSLQPGQSYLLNTYGQLVRVTIPKMTPADLVAIGRCLGSERVPMGFRPPVKEHDGNPAGTQVEPNGNAAELAPGAETITPAERARILALFFDEGLDTAEIIRRLWPELSRGRATQERSRVVLAVIRQAARGA
jgi:hypothetical protein